MGNFVLMNMVIAQNYPYYIHMTVIYPLFLPYVLCYIIQEPVSLKASLLSDNTSEEITFESLSGDLITKRDGSGITMNFPLNKPIQQVCVKLYMYTNICKICKLFETMRGNATEYLHTAFHGHYPTYNDIERLCPASVIEFDVSKLV